ncbi:hypothetical protein G6011_00935 [Alternaria panax]|uniref:Heterokaryon incompatibility domain-containing protein n=1 Tax=Alternaria panax TaxID=48097 RepID=A0AAD4IK65_9PLEO|nr:hypothetical protein G6011_00935 [Alternaria panax]
MADIYNCAIVTIMAASATNSQGGLFRDRATNKERVALPYTDTNRITELSIVVSKVLLGYERISAKSPLFQRGW